MKKNYFLAICSLLVGIAMQAQVSYTGNGNTGFGGALGNATLNVSDNGTDVTFAFNSNAGGNVFVVYIDSKSGGFNDTESFTDNSDGGRRAVSTIDGANNPSINFPAGFTADYALAMGGSWAALFELNTGTFGAVGLTFSSNSASVTFAQLGTNATSKFDFVVTLNSETTFLSDEVIGTSTVSGNPGFSGNITFTDSKSYPNTWTGATDTDWATANNWTEGVPSSTHNIYIPAGLTNYPVASSAVTINKGTIKSDASLIANDAFTGTITYERTLGTTNWYLMSSPVAGVTFNDAYVSTYAIDSGTGSNRGVATYTTASDAWSYLQSGGSLANTAGVGYSVKQSTAGTVGFTGTLNTTDVSVAVSSTGNGFNLIGNPFTAAINSATFLTDNSANLVSQTIWLFDQSTGNYVTKVTGDTFIVAPTQGFFVRSSNGTNLSIAESYQTTGGAFQKTNKAEVVLNMTDGTNNRFAKLYYFDANASKGFDNGYDGETFSGVANSFDVFTHLLEGSVGKNYQVQSLPKTEMESMVVPIGVKATAGKELTFTADAMNLPNGLKVFLEDRETNTFTELTSTNNYKVTLGSDLNGIGRFFVHTASSVLSTPSIDLTNVNIYTTGKQQLRITGVNSDATVKVFNILGKQVFENSFSSKGVTDLNLPAVQTGVYIIQLTTTEGKLNKKIVLE